LYDVGVKGHGPASCLGLGRASRPIGDHYHLSNMVDNAQTRTAAAAYRGFLFSDMRGFTAFAERHGNSAAAEAVKRFLEIARTAIARHEGAEIKTEGDAIHAVFPSASSAVMCGLEIVDAAAELNAKEPDRPLGLGVGVHAGEAVETAEGYIGRAVNIASRLCSAAKPGEVLVSSTVKGITQSSIPVGFIPRGTRRLKGIQDPIVVYAVTRDVNAKAPRTVPRPVVLGGAGVAVVAILAFAAAAGSQLLARPSAAPTQTAPPAAQRVVLGPLAIGTYKSVQFEPAVTFDIKSPDWTATTDVPGRLSLLRGASPRGIVEFLRVEQVVENPCGADEATMNPGPADLLMQLQALQHLSVSEPKTVRIGGYTGRQVDIGVSDASLAACGGPVGGGVAILRAAGEVWNATPGERFRLIALGVGTNAVTIVVSIDWTQTPSVQELESLLQLGQQVLDTVRF
jgi:class 3 adenylate cyclase